MEIDLSVIEQNSGKLEQSLIFFDGTKLRREIFVGRSTDELNAAVSQRRQELQARTAGEMETMNKSKSTIDRRAVAEGKERSKAGRKALIRKDGENHQYDTHRLTGPKDADQRVPATGANGQGLESRTTPCPADSK